MDLSICFLSLLQDCLSNHNKPRKNISKEVEDKPKEWDERLKIDWIFYGEDIKGMSKSGGLFS